MKRDAQPKNILLGEGVFLIDDKIIGLTKGGGTFTVEYEYIPIEADGDTKKVKGRIQKYSALPKLTMNKLELLSNFDMYHPGIEIDTESKEGYAIIKGTGEIDEENDYHKVSFKGLTKDRREVVITIDEAINLENMELPLNPKDQVVDKATFEGVEVEDEEWPVKEGWSIEYKLGEE